MTISRATPKRLDSRPIPRALRRTRSVHRRRGAGLCVVAAALIVAAGDAAYPDSPVASELRERAVAVIRGVAAEEVESARRQSPDSLADNAAPPATYAALETLIRLEYVQESPKDLPSKTPWHEVAAARVDHLTSYSRIARAESVERLVSHLVDGADGSHRVAAARALSELQVALAGGGEPLTRVTALLDADTASQEASSRLDVYLSWILANSSDEQAAARGQELLVAALEQEGAVRSHAALALLSLGTAAPGAAATLRSVLARQPETSPQYDAVLAAAVVLGIDPSASELLRRRLTSSAPGVRRGYLCRALSLVGSAADLDLLTPLLDDSSAEVRLSAANAILRIGRRAPHRLFPIDWAVISVYALVMLLIGWYYSRRTRTREDYLLGGRNMRPWRLGMSLFASLLSTISFLGWPGEMIRHGPMYLGALITYPLTFFVAGWFLIPFIMRLRVTSAYEILEGRLGLSVRMLGSFFFLAMRVIWMSVIIFTTTTKVLVPIAGIDPAYSNWICVGLGFLTVAYTSLGGLRAVVLTDVIQTFILLSAAVLTIVLITVELGGVGAWWPREWAAHWSKPTLGYDSEHDRSVLGFILATFTWYICTSGSDQMAIQRYLATRDAKTARRVLGVSLFSDSTVNVLMALTGMSLLAYFQSHPHMVEDGQRIISNPDRLFPQFITFGLPIGVSGLVIAGLLAAAMSSLSSGVNSSCSVITVDFLTRFRGTSTRATSASPTDGQQAREARIVSLLIGVVIVFLSMAVGRIEGNLMEIAYKTVNLLTAPLFGLFFFAMFVPRANAVGVFIGTAVGFATIVVMNYTRWLPMSFLWGMPVGLSVQVLVGTIASWLVSTCSGGAGSIASRDATDETDSTETA